VTHAVMPGEVSTSVVWRRGGGGKSTVLEEESPDAQQRNGSRLHRVRTFFAQKVKKEKRLGVPQKSYY